MGIGCRLGRARGRRTIIPCRLTGFFRSAAWSFGPRVVRGGSAKDGGPGKTGSATDSPLSVDLPLYIHFSNIE
jgi:hypothetical protein